MPLPDSQPMSTPQISKLTQRIESCDLADSHEHAAIRDELIELRDVLLRVSSTELAGCMDAAVTLTRHMPQVGERAGHEIRAIICRLVNVVAESLPKVNSSEGPDPNVAPAMRMRQLKQPQSEPAGRGDNGLRLINDMYLGEVLIQLGVLNKEKVDAAIKTQQATGMRFGEALVHLGAASWEDVDNGLRLQEHLSKTSRLNTDGVTRLQMVEKEGPPISAFGSDHLNVLNDMMLGEEMIRMGTITREQLLKALDVQSAAGIRIGEALVEIGAASWDQVAEGVRMQERHRDQGGDRPQRSISL